MKIRVKVAAKEVVTMKAGITVINQGEGGGTGGTIMLPFDSFPLLGTDGILYVDTNNGNLYRWNGAVYARVGNTLKLGEKSTDAYRGDRGKTAYDHSQTTHAPSDAQKNSDITKQEIEDKLTGEISSHSHAAAAAPERGFALNVQCPMFSPLDSTVYYFGNIAIIPSTGIENLRQIYIRKTCSLKIAEIYLFSGTAGSDEEINLYIRKNGTDDILISSVSLSNRVRVFSNILLNIPFVAGDYIEIKFSTPNWATNPVNSAFGGYLYFELP